MEGPRGAAPADHALGQPDDHVTCILVEGDVFPQIAKPPGGGANTIPALSIVDGAIGMLGRGQLDRLEGLLRARSGKCAILVLHHHLGCPPEILSRLKVSPLEVKVLQLADTARLRGILSSHARVVVFHGHKHVGYWADLERIRVISAPSVAYGNRVGPHNCHVYAVDPEGQVSLVASMQISASPRGG